MNYQMKHVKTVEKNAKTQKGRAPFKERNTKAFTNINYRRDGLISPYPNDQKTTTNGTEGWILMISVLSLYEILKLISS